MINGATKISAAIITKNEEGKIADCLESLSFVDEIVIVDCGSTDKTVEIATDMGAKVVFNEWPGHIQQKNYAIAQTSGQWVLSLDADERVSGALRKRILGLLKNPKVDGYAIPRLVYYINRWVWRCGWYPARKIRLFKRELGRWTGENPHDRIELNGKAENLNEWMYHLSFDNISGHLATIDSFTEIAAQERVKKGDKSSMFHVLFRPPVTFLKMYFFKLGFLDGIPGFIICSLSAYHVFCKYVKIMEMSQEG